MTADVAPARPRPTDAARTAVAFLTRLPVGRLEPVPLGEALGWFPLVGLLVALPAGAGMAAGAVLWSPLVGGVLAVAAAAATTGAFHEDGLADTVDGLWGGWSTEQRLEIMRDSRLGTYGAVALVVALALQVALLATVDPLDAVRALVVGHVVGRATVLPLVARLPAARSDGQGARVAAAPSGGAQVLAGATVLVVGAVAVGPWLPLVLLAAVPGPWLFARAARRLVGGVTGDVLGAANVTAHLGVLAAVTAVARHVDPGPTWWALPW